MNAVLIAGVVLLGGCVPLEQLPPEVRKQIGAEAPEDAAPAAPAFADLDPGANDVSSLHFALRGYDANGLRMLSMTAENLYNKIASDTGLYSYLSSAKYRIVMYRDRQEYLDKTKMPEWSRAVAAGDGVYSYPGGDLEPSLAHEMTHLLFNTFMGPEAARRYRWINEGIAMNQEMAKWPEGDRQAYRASAAQQLRDGRMPFSQMTFFVPISEEARRVDVWYQQVQSVTAFLLAQGSSLSFAGLLQSLRNGVDMDRAIGNHYPGKFRDLKELESAWKYTL